MSWHKIACEESDALHDKGGLEISSGFTDMDGEHGDPQIRREWSDKTTGKLVVRDVWHPGRQVCEHWEYQEDGW